MVYVDNYPQTDGLVSERGIWSFKPGAAITKGMTVYLSGTDTVLKVATGSEALVVGVALEDASAADTPAYISVALKGSGKIVKCAIGEAVNKGKLVIAMDGGKVGNWPASPAIGDMPKVVGKALQEGAADTDEILVALC